MLHWSMVHWLGPKLLTNDINFSEDWPISIPTYHFWMTCIWCLKFFKLQRVYFFICFFLFINGEKTFHFHRTELIVSERSNRENLYIIQYPFQIFPLLYFLASSAGYEIYSGIVSHQIEPSKTEHASRACFLDDRMWVNRVLSFRKDRAKNLATNLQLKL
jgi:hypothetical protein